MAICHEGTPPPEQQVQQLVELIHQAEPAVQHYLKECVCCFAAGAYSAAIVAAWCAIALYLRLVVEAVGLEVARVHYRDEEKKAGQPFMKLIELSDTPFRVIYKRMELVEYQFTSNMKRLDDLYKQRCQYAHPTGEKAKQQEAFDYVIEASWLLTRRVDQERFQNSAVVMKCAEDKELRLNQDDADRLVSRLRADQSETLAVSLLKSLLSTEQDLDQERALTLWDALKSRLSEDSRIRLMKMLADGLSFLQIDQVIDAYYVARNLVFWPEAKEQPEIWQYLVARRNEIPERYKAFVRRHAPPPYSGQIDEPLD